MRASGSLAKHDESSAGRGITNNRFIIIDWYSRYIVGLYPGGEATSEFAERLAGYKTSKGAIQLPLGKQIDYELITDIVRWRVKWEAKGSDTL